MPTILSRIEAPMTEQPQSRPPPLIVHQGHSNHVTSVAFSPDGNSVASGSYDTTIRMWDSHRPSPIGKRLRGHSDWIRSVAYSPLGDVIASASNDKTIRLWDVNSRQQLGARKGNYQFLSVAFSPDNKLIASGCGGFYSPSPTSLSVQLWDVQKMTAVTNPFTGHTGSLLSVQFSPDGSRLVSGSYDETIRVWDVERGRTVVGPLKGHIDSVRSVAFSPDGSQTISCSYDCTVRMWDARDGKLIGNPYEGHTDWVHSVAFSPRGTYVVSGSEDKTVRLWDIRMGRQVYQPFEEHAGEVYSVAFSPCGQYVVSGSIDEKVIIRRVSVNYPETSTVPDSHTSVDEGGLVQREATQIISHMSTQQIFECLIAVGCIDLSAQMDTHQNTAMIVSGGGFGDIWVGQLHNGTKVAIKAWRTDALEKCRDKTIKRAARELFYWSQMEHKNIHKLMGVIVFKNQYLGMVSEWMENGHLHKYLENNPDADRYLLCIDVASGLEYMHSRSTVHGDLKAINVLVSSDGIARISDFDFSVMSEASSLMFSESSNTRSGSIRWVAPEMLVEESPKRTKESDVYALGMTMLEVFTGEVPYPNCRADFSVLTTVTRGTLPTRPTDRLKNNKQGNIVWELLLKCWSREVSERPSARQVVKVLKSQIGAS